MSSQILYSLDLKMFGLPPFLRVPVANGLEESLLDSLAFLPGPRLPFIRFQIHKTCAHRGTGQGIMAFYWEDNSQGPDHSSLITLNFSLNSILAWCPLILS